MSMALVKSGLGPYLNQQNTHGSPSVGSPSQTLGTDGSPQRSLTKQENDEAVRNIKEVTEKVQTLLALDTKLEEARKNTEESRLEADKHRTAAAEHRTAAGEHKTNAQQHFSNADDAQQRIDARNVDLAKLDDEEAELMRRLEEKRAAKAAKKAKEAQDAKEAQLAADKK